MRAAPAIGALLMAAYLAHHSLKRRAGLRMFQAVIGFGLATIVFALSHLLWLSLIALAVAGAADMVSVVIRVSLVQLATPDAMRGRVGAVNYLFHRHIESIGRVRERHLGGAHRGDARRFCWAESPRSALPCFGCGYSPPCVMSRHWNNCGS